MCAARALILLILFVWSSTAAGEPDADRDGLSDFAEVHKYLTDPNNAHTGRFTSLDGDWDERKEFTYTITAVLQLARPYNPAEMNDDYQDARVLSEDNESVTVEVVYYPLNTNAQAIGENAHWRRDYASMREYLRPAPTENWDEKMRVELIAQLKAEGIDPDALTDKELVSRVARWAKRRSHFVKPFTIWYTHYPEGRPAVFPALRPFFEREKPTADWTDEAMFAQEALGREMFYSRAHGSCTSYSVYLATILRALGIPTRIVFVVPPADVNDPKQVETLLENIHHHGVRATVKHGLPKGGFVNHVFNEVFVGNRWVRLNYAVLGQNTLDSDYLGLMTHILTVGSLSEAPLAETWGRRWAIYPGVSPRLSSKNPYRLLRVSDHFGAHSQIANPPVEE